MAFRNKRLHITVCNFFFIMYSSTNTVKVAQLGPDTKDGEPHNKVAAIPNYSYRFTSANIYRECVVPQPFGGEMMRKKRKRIGIKEKSGEYRVEGGVLPPFTQRVLRKRFMESHGISRVLEILLAKLCDGRNGRIQCTLLEV